MSAFNGVVGAKARNLEKTVDKNGGYTAEREEIKNKGKLLAKGRYE